jgi:hypothetical protein
MAEDLPGPPGSGNHDERPGERPVERPTEPVGPSAQPPPPHGQAGGVQYPAGSGPPPGPQPSAPPYWYGQPGYGYPPGPENESMATAALVVAIVGFFVCFPLGGIVALILANSAIQRIEASGGRLTGLEQARTARIIAIVELALAAVMVLVAVIVGLIALTVSNRSGTAEPVPGIVIAQQWHSHGPVVRVHLDP